jgi:uncharacterized protein (TIGR00661 family)
LTGNFNIQRILVAPLDWGLGHATRCIPIIKALLANGYEVLLAGEGKQASLLRQEFPQLICLPLKGYRIRYSRARWWLPFKLLQQLPRLLGIIRREKQWLEQCIGERNIDLVISDNRYGLYSQKVPCIFITHQLTIKAPLGWVEKLLQRINYRYINRFTACWVPDTASYPGAAGILSHPGRLPRIPVHYLGLLARFEKKELNPVYDYCIVLSGPEPQRSILEKKIFCCLEDITAKILLVRGLPGSKEILVVPEHVEVRNHLHTADLQMALLQSKYIVSRSGYTTVMELLSLGKKSLLIPTPGQTEQEYLAELLQQQGACCSVTQKEFDCMKHFEMVKNFSYQLPGVEIFNPERIKELISGLN